MSKTRVVAGVLGACAVLLTSPAAQAERAEPVPVYGWYDVHVDFAAQTFNGVPGTPMESKTFPVQFTTTCDVDGCVMRMDNSGDQVRNPQAPLEYSYRWNADVDGGGRWETSGEQPYLCSRTDAASGVPSTRSDFWIPNGDGSFRGERTLVTTGTGCPGEGPGTYWVPISMTPIDPPA